MIDLDFEVIDLHSHLRNNPAFHAKLAFSARIGKIVAMANTNPPIDSPKNLKAYKKKLGKFKNRIYFVSAITKDLKGKDPVDIDKLCNRVVGFSDDGNCLKDLEILKYFLQKELLVMAHLEPEVEMLEKYIRVYSKVRTGRLHIQHISRKESVKLIGKAKRLGLNISCEVTPHHLYFPSEIEDKAVNPPLGNLQDIEALRVGLKNGTIDCIASDYAPIPRPKGTGFASYASFLPLCWGLVFDDTINKKQLKEKLYSNPLKIISTK